VIVIAIDGTAKTLILYYSALSSRTVFLLPLSIGFLKEKEVPLSALIYLPWLVDSFMPLSFSLPLNLSASKTNSWNLVYVNFSFSATPFLILIGAILLRFLLHNFMMLSLSCS
jgi:hypothetical protein